jgi:hypothetical protein
MYKWPKFVWRYKATGIRNMEIGKGKYVLATSVGCFIDVM